MTNFRLEKGYLDKLDELAKAHQRTRTGEVKTALLEYFRKFDPAFTLVENPGDPD
jgi:predicted transcriptional regulator